MSLDLDDLDAIEARANAATPGPWHQGRGDRRFRYEHPSEAYTREDMNDPESVDVWPLWHHEEDAAFVVHAREDVPALVAEVRRLRQRPTEDEIAREVFWSDDQAGHIKGRWTFDTIPEVGRENYRRLAKAILALFPSLSEKSAEADAS